MKLWLESAKYPVNPNVASSVFRFMNIYDMHNVEVNRKCKVTYFDYFQSYAFPCHSSVLMTF